jgi:flagellar biosynthesis protein FliQ
MELLISLLHGHKSSNPQWVRLISAVMNRRTGLLIALILALITRIWLVWVLRWNSPNADEAVAGLMARHIEEGRDFPVFFYGQSYFGALEPYLNALLFRLVGFNPNLIFVLPVVFAVASVWGEYRLATKFAGIGTALSAALVIALAPGALLDGTLSAAGGFGLALLFELAAIVLFMDLFYADSVTVRPFLGFCLISGLLFWVWQIYIPIFLFLILLWIARKPRVRARLAAAGGALFLASSSPLWIFNFAHGGATFAEVFSKFAAADTSAGPLAFAKSFVGNRVWNLAAYMQAWLSSLSGGNPVLLVAIVIGIGLALHSSRARWNLQSLSLAPLLLLCIAAVAFLFGHRSPRYLYILPFLLVPSALSGWRQLGHPVVIGVTGVIILTDIASIGQVVLTYPPRPDWSAVIDSIESTRLSYGYSDFWNAYPITFVSAEQIIISPTIATPAGERTDRYPLFTASVDAAPLAFALVPENSPDISDIDRLARQAPSQNGLRREPLPGLSLYFPLKQDPLRRWLASRALP